MQDSRSDKGNVVGGSIDYGKSPYGCLVPVVMPPIHLQGLSGAGFSAAGLLPSAQVSSSAVVVDGLGWTCSEDGAAHVVVAPAQSRSSASSTVLSPDDGDDNNCSRGNSSSNHSGSVLKEHDYIGLTEVSSSPGTMHASEIEIGDGKARASEVDLKLEETDLRLGLGPPDVSHSADAKSGAHVALLLASGYGSSPAAFSNSKQRCAEQKLSEGEKAAYASYDHPPCKEGSTRLLGHDSAENTDSSCAERGVSITEDGSDKRPPNLPDIPPSTLWQTQVQRNLEGIRVATGLDFSTLPAPISGQEFDVSRAAHLNGYATSRFALAAAKNGVKRAYDEAMIEKRFNHGEIRSSSPYEGVTRPTAAGGAAQMLGGTPPPAGIMTSEAELKRFAQQSKLPQSPFVYGWASVHPPALGTFGPFQSLQSKGIGGVAPHSDSVADPPVSLWETRSKAPEALLPVERRPPTSMEKQQSPTPEVSPQKGQVVGWPPIRSFRKNTLAAPPKPVEDGEGSGETPDTCPGPATSPAVSLYVKVNMDGVPIGRKVDLHAYNGYEALILALEEMFQRPHAGQGGAHVVSGNEKIPSELTRGRLINGSDFMLTYEDKEGDWMLVGDVPWGMFVNTVRRLWIMKASETTTGLVPRGSRNVVSHGNTRSSART